MIDWIGERVERVVLVGVDDDPVPDTDDIYRVQVAWFAPDIWQASLLLLDGRSIIIPKEFRNQPGTITVVKQKFKIFS